MRRWLPLVLLLFAVALVFSARLWIEWQWFVQFGWGAVVGRRWLLQLLLALFGVGVAALLQRWLAWFWRRSAGSQPSRRSAPVHPLRFGLRPLPYAGVLLLLAAVQLSPLILLLRLAQRLLLDPFDPRRLHGLIALHGSGFTVLDFGAVLLLLLGLVLQPQAVARLLAGAASLISAIVMGRAWGIWTQAVLIPDTGLQEPLLGADISFGLARFPALALLLTLALSLWMVHMGAALWGEMARSPHLSDGRFPGFSAAQLRALRWPTALASLLIGASFWLGRHQLLMSTTGSVPGAGWLDVHLMLPLRTVAAIVALAAALVLVAPLRRRGLRGPLVLAVSCALLVLALLEVLLAPLLQGLVVRPRELERELPFLQRSIEATRAAFQLDRIRTDTVNPRNRLSREDVAAASATLRNIRLWDSQPLLATNRQLQQLRVYYRFSGAAVDRYALGDSDDARGRQQIIITARELDQAALPVAARTWLNRHLVFTHGFGFTMSPVNTRNSSGLPDYFISDLGASTRVQGNAALGISAEAVRSAIPTGRPSLYFGALASPYALAPTSVQEFDYPQGDENIYTHYDGKAGVPLGSTWQRLAASLYLFEPKLLVRGALIRETRLLLRREVKERLRRLAPFVRFEGEPYLVSAQLDGPSPFPKNQQQFWIVEGFTSSRIYPYSASLPGNPDVRYLRNAVKAVVDAYNGTVAFYVAEPDDPLIAGWQRLFPELFQPLSAMPPALQRHIRYAQWQFELQTQQLLRYHVTDPRVFYSGDDVWQVPKELYGRTQVPVKPYHISAQLSPAQPPEFLLLQPLTPLARPNLAGWLAARSDAPNYGELVLLRFPTQTPILGPQQIQALINQNPQISQQFGLWDRAGSEVIQGNLLVVPVGQALLYVEPVYLKARQGGLPTLTRVVVTDGTRIAMESTLERGIEALLDPARSQPAEPPLPNPSLQISGPNS